MQKEQCLNPCYQFTDLCFSFQLQLFADYMFHSNSPWNWNKSTQKWAYDDYKKTQREPTSCSLNNSSSIKKNQISHEWAATKHYDGIALKKEQTQWQTILKLKFGSDHNFREGHRRFWQLGNDTSEMSSVSWGHCRSTVLKPARWWKGLFPHWGQQ